MRGGQGLGERVEQRVAARATIAPPASRNGSSQKRSSSRRRLSSRIARSRPLRCWSARPYVARCAAYAGEPRRRELVERRPAERRRAGDEEHLLGREQRRPAGRRPGPAARRADAVDPDPLAAGRSRSAPARTMRDLDASSAPTRPSIRASVGAPADELAVGVVRCERPQRQQHDRLEQARLAGGVRAPDELRARAEGGVERRVAAEVEQAERLEHGSSVRGARRAGLRDGGRQDVVRTGITTWT